MSDIRFDFRIDFKRTVEPKSIFKLEKYHRGNPIRKIRFQNNLMFSVSKSIKITDLNNQKLVRKISNGQTKIYALAIIDDYLVGIGDDLGNFKAWDYRVERPIYMSLRECETYISDLDVDSNKQIVVASSGEGTLSAFNIRAKRMEFPQSELFDSGFQCVRFAHEKNKVIVGAEDGVLNIFNKNEWGNISDRYPVKSNQNETSIECLELLDDEKNCFAIGSFDGTVEIISLFPHQNLCTLINDRSSIESIHVNMEKKKIVSVSDNRIHLFSYDIYDDDDRHGRKSKSQKKSRDDRGSFFADLIPND